MNSAMAALALFAALPLLAGAMRVQSADFPKCQFDKQRKDGLLPTPQPKSRRFPDDPDEVLVFDDATATRWGAVIQANGAEPPLQCGGCGGCGIGIGEKCDTHDGAVVILLQGNLQMYYHFVGETMSRLSLAAEQFPDVVNDPTTLFLTGRNDGYAAEWAEVLGIPKERLTSNCTRAKKVLWTPTNGCCSTRPAAVQGMRRMIHAKYWPNADASRRHSRQKPKALVVQRCVARSRSIFNHDDIVQGLLDVGYDVVVHSDIDLPNAFGQCSMFYDADLVVGPHGAGLVNIICCRPGTPIIEVETSRPDHNLAFVSLASSLNLAYYPVETRPPFELEYSGNPGTVNVSAILEVASELKPTLPF